MTNIDSAYVQTTLANYQDQLQDYISQTMPDATVEDLLGKKEVVKQEVGILPASLPYKKIVTGARYSEVPDNLRHKVTFEIRDPYLLEVDLSYTASIPELAGKRITLSYAPATTDDEDTITSYGGIYNVPAYLVKMKPQIKVEGMVKAIGESIGLGEQQTFDMRFSIPGYGTDIVSNRVTAGAYYGIGLNPYKIPVKQLEMRKVKIEFARNAVTPDTIFSDGYIGELFYTTAITYFYELDLYDNIFARSYKVVTLRQVAETMVGQELSVSYIYGIPIDISEDGMLIDVDRYILSPVSISGDSTNAQQFMLSAGQMSSAMEHRIFEELFGRDAISAVKALGIANNQGIPIYTINRDNISLILSVLTVSNSVKRDIQDAVNAGKSVMVPKQNITYNGWTGVGYIITDSQTGAGEYRISANLAGGGYSKIAGCAGTGGWIECGERFVLYLTCIASLAIVPMLFLVALTILLPETITFFILFGYILSAIVIYYTVLIISLFCIEWIANVTPFYKRNRQAKIFILFLRC